MSYFLLVLCTLFLHSEIVLLWSIGSFGNGFHDTIQCAIIESPLNSTLRAQFMNTQYSLYQLANDINFIALNNH